MVTHSPSDFDKNRDRSGLPESVSDLKDHTKQALQDAKQTVSDMANRGWQAGRDITREGMERVEKQVHDRPMTSLAVAGLVGFAVGMLLRRDRH